jgi:hypothetical protein
MCLADTSLVPIAGQSRLPCVRSSEALNSLPRTFSACSILLPSDIVARTSPPITSATPNGAMVDVLRWISTKPDGQKSDWYHGVKDCRRGPAVQIPAFVAQFGCHRSSQDVDCVSVFAEMNLQATRGEVYSPDYWQVHCGEPLSGPRQIMRDQDCDMNISLGGH